MTTNQSGTAAVGDRRDRAPAADLLRNYLDDHWAGAGGGRELAKQIAGRHENGPWSEPLAELASEIAADEARLDDVREAVDAGGGCIKRVAAQTAERVSRLVTSQQADRAPLHRVLELEAMMSGVLAKRRLWVALHESGVADRFEPQRLAERAGEQLELLALVHADAARSAFAAGGGVECSRP
ncbi:MAG: hypothetical protein HKN44_00680 [Ilumatobacter sp.]|nr:hypothetical protein [Ilumatobacter sp.]